MRELKFRGWATCGYNSGFVYFDLREDNDFAFYEFYSSCDLDNIEQYTGLKDKNGKEIYIGDIVRAEDDGRYLVGTVEWNEDYAKCEVIYSQITGNSFEFEGDSGYPVANSCEVIGNIHENPELQED